MAAALLSLGLAAMSPARALSVPFPAGRQPGEPTAWFDEAEPGPLMATQGALEPRRLTDRPGIDLLLERPLDLLSHQTPWLQLSAPNGAPMTDLRAFAPDFPAHPMFPGYGLSFEPSPAALLPAAAPERAWVPGAVASRAEPSDADTLREALGPERLRDLKRLRQWLQDNRGPLLAGLGAVAVLTLAAVLVRRWLDWMHAREAARARRRRRRRPHTGDSTHRPH